MSNAGTKATRLHASMRGVALPALLLCTLAITGCDGDQDDCDSDEDCATSEVCNSDGVCVPYPVQGADAAADVSDGSDAATTDTTAPSDPSDTRLPSDSSTGETGVVSDAADTPALPDAHSNPDTAPDVTGCPKAIARAKTSQKPASKHLNIEPLQTVTLDASRSIAASGNISKYRWTIVQSPRKWPLRLTPDRSKPSVKLFAGVVGKYVVELHVWDDKGKSCAPSRVVVEAVPDHDIYVQLDWRTKGDTDQLDKMGSDLDLHYMNSSLGEVWNKKPWDVFWMNKKPNWGQSNRTDDDPKMTRDDTDGAGPEVVAHDHPHTGYTYTVAAYYYDDHGLGPSKANLEIYSGKNRVFQQHNKFLAGTFAFWKVAVIKWPGPQVFKHDKVTDGFPNK